MGILNLDDQPDIYEAKPDYRLFNLIAENTKNLKIIQNKLAFAVNADELQKLSEAFANLVDAQSKLAAIAHHQNTELRRVLDYAEYLKNKNPQGKDDTITPL